MRGRHPLPNHVDLVDVHVRTFRGPILLEQRQGRRKVIGPADIFELVAVFLAHSSDTAWYQGPTALLASGSPTNRTVTPAPKAGGARKEAKRVKPSIRTKLVNLKGGANGFIGEDS